LFNLRGGNNNCGNFQIKMIRITIQIIKNKDFNVKRKLLILLLLFVTLTGKTQERKYFSLFTDRNLYTSGETLLFKIFGPENESSGIIHIDLINASGKKIVEINKKTTDHQADGFIYLPDSLSSGYYLLCTSTRNNPTLTFNQIYICNRFTGIPEAGTAIRSSETMIVAENQVNDLEIKGIDKTSQTRSKVQATIHLPGKLLSQIKGNLWVSIAETISGYNSESFLKSIKPKEDQIVEKDGVILEGFVKDFKTGEPFKNGIVFLSIPDSIPRFNFYRTGSDGYFYFQFDNYYGKIPVVIQGLDPERKRLVKIVLNHQESVPAGISSFENWTVPPELRKIAAQNIDALTFRKIFNQQEITIQPGSRPKAEAYPFYGVPTSVIDPHPFIDLPDFTEISRELLPGVKFRAYNRIPSLQVLNSAMHAYFEDPPLLLIDGIPIHDLNIVKPLGSKDIDRVEICLGERFYGDLAFPGVVAIYTSKSNFSRIVESDDLIKFNLDVIQPAAQLNIPSEKLQNEPDLRKVLLWKPSLKPEETIRLNFETSDIRGSFKLLVRGTTSDGSVFYKEQIFEVN